MAHPAKTFFLPSESVRTSPPKRPRRSNRTSARTDGFYSDHGSRKNKSTPRTTTSDSDLTHYPEALSLAKGKLWNTTPAIGISHINGPAATTGPTEDSEAQATQPLSLPDASAGLTHPEPAPTDTNSGNNDLAHPPPGPPKSASGSQPSGYNSDHLDSMGTPNTPITTLPKPSLNNILRPSASSSDSSDSGDDAGFDLSPREKRRNKKRLKKFAKEKIIEDIALSPQVMDNSGRGEPEGAPAFILDVAEPWKNEREMLSALTRVHEDLYLRVRLTNKGFHVIFPSNDETTDIFETISDLEGKPFRFIRLPTHVHKRKGVLIHAPLSLSPDTIRKEHPRVIQATRNKRWDHARKEEVDTHSITITMKTDRLPTSLRLTAAGTLPLRPHFPEPVRCYRCQRFGHIARNCGQPQRCGLCAEPHNTRLCLQKERTDVPIKCANCLEKHCAASARCPVRKQECRKIRERVSRYTGYQPAPRSSAPPPSSVEHYPALHANAGRTAQAPPSSRRHEPSARRWEAPTSHSHQASCPSHIADRIRELRDAPTTPPPQTRLPPGASTREQAKKIDGINTAIALLKSHPHVPPTLESILTRITGLLEDLIHTHHGDH